MKICPNCHAELEDELLFCVECGAEQPAPEAVPTPPAEPQKPKKEKKEKPPKAPKAEKAPKPPKADKPVGKKGRVALVVLCVLLGVALLAAAGIAAFYFLSQPEEVRPHSVTFLLNDGTPCTYEMQAVPHEDLADKPVSPKRLGCTFNGWYTDEEATDAYNFNTPVTKDVVLYAGWKTPVLEGALYGGGSGGGTVYSISGLEVKDGVLRATVNTNDVCMLDVHFYDEETGEHLTQVSVHTPAYCELTAIVVPVEEELPQYFVIEAVLKKGGKNLCDPYRCIKYTSAFENHLKQTVHDFPGKTVVNFDQHEDRNFGVLADGVKVIGAGADANKVSSMFSPINGEDGEVEYVEQVIVQNPDSAVKALAVGDRVYFEGTPHLLKIGEIKTEADGTMVLIPSGDVVLTDFYQMINANMAYSIATAIQDASQAAPAWELLDVSGKGSLSGGIPFEYKPFDWLKISGGVTVSGTLKAVLHVDVKWFQADYEASVIVEHEFKFEMAAHCTLDNEDAVNSAMEPIEISVGRWTIPTSVPGVTASVKPAMTLEWSLEGGVTFEYTIKGTSGFRWNEDGKQNIDKKETATKLMADAKFEVKAGPKLEISVEFCKEVLKAKLTLAAGAQAEAKAEHGGEWTDTESKHACSLCLDGKAGWFAEVSAKLSYKFTKKLSGDLVKWTIVKVEGNFLISPKFFVSVFNDEDSIYGGKIKFGWGECENKQYRTTLSVKSASGTEIPGVSVVVTKSDGTQVGASVAPYDLYLHNGTYTATCTVGEDTASKSFTVSGDACAVELRIEARGELSGKVCKASDRSTPVPGATITIYANMEPHTTITSDYDGNYSVSLPAGTYWVVITGEGYLDFASYANVQAIHTTYMETFLMVEGEEGSIGTPSGRVVNSLFGTGEGGVSLSFRKYWNNTEDSGEVLATATTDSDGWYSVELPIGNYTVKASKEEFTDAFFNIVVQEGVTGDQNGIITPVMGEGVGNTYRITLTWGENPSDLDSHMSGRDSYGNWFHVYFGDRDAYEGDIHLCNLDYDDTTSYGPEHITLTVTGEEAYYYYIHHFAGSGSIASSGAQITVEQGDALIAVYNVPANLGDDIYWNVFAIKNGQLIPNNTITSSPDTSYAE